MTPPIDDVPCIEFVEVITDYLDGALPTDETRRLEEHLAICTGCESALAQFRELIRLSGRVAESDIDALTPEQREPVMAAFREWAASRGL
jgi:anti-sigma factor RsiW